MWNKEARKKKYHFFFSRILIMKESLDGRQNELHWSREGFFFLWNFEEEVEAENAENKGEVK